MQEEVTYAKSVGNRLRSLRRQRGLSLLAVEEASEREFKASVVGAYERGERIISVLRLQRLALLYRVPVDQLLPRAVAPGSDEAEPEASYEPRRPVKIDMVRLTGPDETNPEHEAIRQYVGTIQVERGDFDGISVAIREEDLRALGRVFERDGATMEKRLQTLGLLL